MKSTGLFSAKCKALVCILLSTAISGALRADNNPIIKSIRTVVYEAVPNGSEWETGKVIDNIKFAKYDSEQRIITENVLRPDGSEQGKLVYKYNKEGQVLREIYASAGKGVSKCWDYLYREDGTIRSIVFLNGNQDTLRILSVERNGNGKIAMRTVDDREKGTVYKKEIVYNDKGIPTRTNLITNLNKKKPKKEKQTFEKRDTVSLKRIGGRYLMRDDVVEDEEEQARQKVNIVKQEDGAGNWTERYEDCDENNKPSYIVCRDIEYVGASDDRKKAALHGKVRRVAQNSYKAVANGTKGVSKGSRSGVFFVYEFDKNGKKTMEDTFKNTVKVRRTRFEYNEQGRLSKERYINASGVATGSKTFAYNNGLLSSCSMFNAKGEVLWKEVLRYDLENNPVQRTRYKKDGTKCGELTYKYDSYGQMIESKATLQPEGEEPVPHKIMEYNFNGNIEREEIVSPDGSGSDVYTYKYNAKGEEVSGSSKLKGSSNEANYVYKFQKDGTGNWKIRIKYVNNKPVTYEERKLTYYP